MTKVYILKLATANDIEVGKTYHKDMNLGGFLAQFPEIKILSRSGGVVTATIGKDTFVQTLTDAEALAYINAQGGYDNTA